MQGPPRPPRIERPEAVHDFSVLQRGRDLLLTFTPPALATDGERLTKPVGVEVFRSVMSPGATPPPIPAAGPAWKTYSLKAPGSQPQGSPVTLTASIRDQDISPSRHATWTLAVRTMTRGFRGRALESDLSNPAEVIVQDVSVPVAKIEIKTTEKALELCWEAPSRSVTGGGAPPPSGYRVFRSLTGKPGTFELLVETPGPAASDPNFQFGKEYFYVVRAEFQENSHRAESDDSPAAEITPLDTYPPRAPANLTAVYARGRVDLVWKANTETDLAGYNVERRGAETPYLKLNPALLPTPIFHDASVEIGKKYFYRVRAIDQAGNISPPSEELEVETIEPRGQTGML